MKFILICFIIALVILSVSAKEHKPKRQKVKELKKPSTPKSSKSFCEGQVQSNGTQISGGSCSTTIQGKIPSSDKMTSTLIISPENGAVLIPFTKFSVDILIDNIETGHFSDPDTEYNIDPQDLNSDGLILGHTHVTIQNLDGNKPPNAAEFEFFKGVNDKADSEGRLTVDVVSEDGKAGLHPGNYRICTMAGSFSHQPLVMPVAKRGSQDDCIRITVNDDDDEKVEKVGKGKGNPPNQPKQSERPKQPKKPKQVDQPEPTYTVKQ